MTVTSKNRTQDWVTGPATDAPTVGRRQTLDRPINGRSTTVRVVAATGTVHVPAGTRIREDVPLSPWWTTIVTDVDQTLDVIWWINDATPTFYGCEASVRAAGTIVEENNASYYGGVAVTGGRDTRGNAAACAVRSRLRADDQWTDADGLTWTVTDRLDDAPLGYQPAAA